MCKTPHRINTCPCCKGKSKKRSARIRARHATRDRVARLLPFVKESPKPAAKVRGGAPRPKAPIDPTSGTAPAWFYARRGGDPQQFDLMTYWPEPGEPRRPVGESVADAQMRIIRTGKHLPKMHEEQVTAQQRANAAERAAKKRIKDRLKREAELAGEEYVDRPVDLIEATPDELQEWNAAARGMEQVRVNHRMRYGTDLQLHVRESAALGAVLNAPGVMVY